MVLGWVPFKIVSDSPALHSRWLLLLKIEISSIVHCSFSISQNELNFNCSYMARSSSVFFCEIFLSADLYRLWKLGIFWKKITFKSTPLKPLNQIKPNLAGMVPGWVPLKIVSDSPALHSKWLLLLKIEISSIVHCCFSTSQNELKF
jgi:hypothetical protein